MAEFKGFYRRRLLTAAVSSLLFHGILLFLAGRYIGDIEAGRRDGKNGEEKLPPVRVTLELPPGGIPAGKIPENPPEPPNVPPNKPPAPGKTPVFREQGLPGPGAAGVSAPVPGSVSKTAAETAAKTAYETASVPGTAPEAASENAPAAGSPRASGGVPASPPGPALQHDYDDLLDRLDRLIQSRLTYPPLAKRRGIEGTVVLRLVVAPSGELISAGAEESSGSVLLDRAAVDMVSGFFPLDPGPGGLGENREMRISVRYELEKTFE